MHVKRFVGLGRGKEQGLGTVMAAEDERHVASEKEAVLDVLQRQGRLGNCMGDSGRLGDGEERQT